MNTFNREAYMEDGLGRLMPISKVKEIDKLRNDLVVDLVAKANKTQEAMSRFKKIALSEVDAFVELSAAEYDVKYGGKKGNLKLYSYDHNFMVQVQISEYMSCDERLQIAKKIIDGCFNKWTEDGREEIKTLINDAFTVNQEGKINFRRILALRRLKIKDPDWLKAMELISDSLQVAGSKSYFRIYKRSGPEGKWINLSLDFAAL
ncbi:MAG: DUF3164 family protein [Desulfobacteraceae bacterium]|nr:DUF3164 family protein [Desulfobacteraceae bacterium]